jgi:transposase
MEAITLFVGIDVCKARLDVHLLTDGQSFSVANNAEGHAQLHARLPQPGQCLVVVEATGGYQRDLVLHLVDQGHEVAVVNPKRVRDFARALGAQAKTDRIDARTLARFGEAFRPRTVENASEKQRELAAHVLRRCQLVELRAVEKNHRESAASPGVFKNIQKVIKVLDQQIREVEREIQSLLESDKQWVAKAEIIGSVPGVGMVLVTTLLTEMPELGRGNRKEITALAGLAPYNNDSGKFIGQRRICGGRTAVRKVLYMATLAAARCNPPIKSLYDRLRQAGKPHKVAIVACMRKLLTLLHHLVKTNSTWNLNRAK